MKQMFRLHPILLLATSIAGPVLAGTDPSLAEVYAAARAGQVERAQQMMSQVLRDHPRNAKAHYVTAELYAQQGELALSHRELNIAEGLEPGLPFATSESVRALQGRLSGVHSVTAPPERSQTASSLPSAALVCLALVAVVVAWSLVRRRRAASNVYPQSVGPTSTPSGTPPGAAAAAASPTVGTSVGAGVVGGLASGLAAGAGIVAGEEIARHFLEPDRHESNTSVPSEPASDSLDHDPGGTDFGVSDAASWDDDPAPPGTNDDEWM